ncbi:MAG TPA: hypothetical protein VNT26_14380, partial [Candidatus Sulfotelmatobacter sp.]|nr:hypothetical protein [Candidatus Sulfotelmatobacter sp.]
MRAGATTGIDTFTATAARTSGTTPASLNSNASPDLQVEVENRAPELPDETDADTIITSASGYQEGALREPNFVATDDDGLALVINPMASENWAVIKVYREGSSTAIYTSGALNLNDTQVIKIPKSALPKGSYRYQISIRNSRGETSTKSRYSPTVVNAAELTGITISSAKFTAVFNNTERTENVLTLTTSSLQCSGTVYPERLKIVAGGSELSLAGAVVYMGPSPVTNCTNTYTSQVQLILTPTQAQNLYSATFATASTTVEADAGWYENQNREQAQADKTNNKVTPLAYVGRAEIDLTGKKLTLFGTGFSYTNASLDVSVIKLVDGSSGQELALVPSGTSKNVGTPSRQGDTKYVIPLLDNAITAFTTGGNFTGTDITLEAGNGWFKESSNLAAAQSANLYQQVTITQVRYDATSHKILITGRGFFDGQANAAGISISPAKMEIKDFDATPTILDLTGATPTVVSDTLIELALTAGQITQYAPANFDGYNIFFSAEDGWYTSSRGIPAAGTPNA